MGDYGLKVSKAGYNVDKSEKKCYCNFSNLPRQKQLGKRSELEGSRKRVFLYFKED